MQIRIFKAHSEKALEEKVNQWLNINTQYNVVHMNISAGKPDLFMVIGYTDGFSDQSYRLQSFSNTLEQTQGQQDDANDDFSQAQKLSQILEGKGPKHVKPPPKTIITNGNEKIEPGDLIKRHYGKW